MDSPVERVRKRVRVVRKVMVEGRMDGCVCLVVRMKWYWVEIDGLLLGSDR